MTRAESVLTLSNLLGNKYLALLERDQPANVGHHIVEFLQQDIFRTGQIIDSSFLTELLLQTVDYLHTLPNVVIISRCKNTSNSLFGGRVTIIGDLHGQFRDLENLLAKDGPIGFPSADNKIIVNGDMIDRGEMSVEILTVLMVFVILDPESVILLRGNHEYSPSLQKATGFDTELERKYPGDNTLKWFFTVFFDALPIAAVLDEAVFVVHGGLGALSVHMTVEQINAENRFLKSTLLHELLWNDPSDLEPGITASSRGFCFGADITAIFLSRNNLQLLVRSHEYCETGYRVQHNMSCYTVFSAPNYCNITTNHGAILQFDKPDSCLPSILQFTAAHYPTKGADSDVTD